MMNPPQGTAATASLPTPVALPWMKKPELVTPVPESVWRKAAAALNTQVPPPQVAFEAHLAFGVGPPEQRPRSNDSYSSPASAPPGRPSGPLTYTGFAPSGMSRSARRSKHCCPPSTSFELTVRQRLTCAVLVGVLCRVLLTRNVKFGGAGGVVGVVPLSVTVAPDGIEATATVGKRMQSTFGSDDCRVHVAPVMDTPSFRIWTCISPVSPE